MIRQQVGATLRDGRGVPLAASAARTPKVPQRLLQLAGSGRPHSAQQESRERLDNVLQSPGVPLHEEVREWLEPKFRHDFSHVRIHADSSAGASAAAFGARAFTSGDHVVFARGRYDPHSRAGRKLLAHELTHVVQQSRGPVSGVNVTQGLKVSEPHDRFEVEARHVADGIEDPGPLSIFTSATGAATRGALPLQRAEEAPGPATGAGVPAAGSPAAVETSAPVTWVRGPTIGPPVLLPFDEAARRVNAALDRMTGLSYVRRPPVDARVASADDPVSSAVVQSSADIAIQMDAGGHSPLARVHGGTVGSMQLCWDCLTGEASLRGWLWAGVGYDMPFVGWVGGYYFGEKVWWKGQLQKWFEPGACDAACDANRGQESVSGFGIAGFPIDIKPRQRANFSKGGLEAGFLLSPHGLCDADLELIALVNLLGYLGPIATVATKAVDGVNAVTHGTPHVSLEAGIDASASFHLCRGANSLFAINRADFCAGGFVGGGVGLSHSKSENHGAS